MVFKGSCLPSEGGMLGTSVGFSDEAAMVKEFLAVSFSRNTIVKGKIWIVGVCG